MKKLLVSLVVIALILLALVSFLIGYALSINDTEEPSTVIDNNIEESVNTDEIKKYSIEDIEALFGLSMTDIIQKFGYSFQSARLAIDECNVPIDAHLYNGGFIFYGLFENTSKPTRIECSNNIEIMGLKNGMSFAEIQKVLGNTNVIKTWLGYERNQIYKIEYSLGDITLKALSTNEEGRDSYLALYKGDNEIATNKSMLSKILITYIEKEIEYNKYQKVSADVIENKYGIKLFYPSYLPKRFVDGGLYIQENPGVNGEYMVHKIWYDPESLEYLLVTIYKSAYSREEQFTFGSDTEEADKSINDFISWANYRCIYEFSDRGISIQGFMLLNSDTNADEATRILKSLKVSVDN